jgi:hypothetical protein
MKTWFITLTLLCAAGLAQADGMPSAPASEDAESAPAKMQAQTKQMVHKHKVKRLPHGDLRYCLDLSTTEEIIRCAETPRKR